jgi:hypothetical protein
MNMADILVINFLNKLGYSTKMSTLDDLIKKIAEKTGRSEDVLRRQLVKDAKEYRKIQNKLKEKVEEGKKNYS